MARKVYGVKGLMEWVAIIRVGKASFHIPFKNGSMTAYGVVPAIYETADKITQHIIEHSDYYANGKIYLYKVFETEEDKKAEEAKTLDVVKMSSVEEARDFLVDTFGVTKSELRSRKAIEDYALGKGVKFEGF